MSGFSRCLFCFAGILLTVRAMAATEPRYVEGQVLVRFAGATDVAAAQSQLGPKYVVDRLLVPELNLFLVRLKGGVKVKQAVGMLNRLNAIEWAQPDHEVTLRETVPTDPDFGRQWSLRNSQQKGADISATHAWDIGTGGKDRDGNDLVIAIVDGGVDLKHKDLAGNIWVNPGEIPDNGIDDDGNGYIDDVNGWNAYTNTGTIPANSHGTHVAGIAGASGNNDLHITGINWNVKIMSVAASSNKTSVIAAGYGYVLAQKKLWLSSGGKKGANVVVTNSSFGVDLADCNSGDYPMWNDLYEEMGKVGILSAAATANRGIDVDEKGDVPTGCPSEFIVKVTNTTKTDEKNKGAAWGKTTIELGAPGTEIYSLLPNDKAGNLTGTSMATPHVAGAIALLHSVASPDLHKAVVRDPAEGARLLKSLLLRTVDPLPALKDITVSGGRLNLAAAAQAVSTYQAR